MSAVTDPDLVPADTAYDPFIDHVFTKALFASFLPWSKVCASKSKQRKKKHDR
jgi:hypothetical protein